MSAQAKGQEGTVLLRLFVSADGTVTKARVVQSSGFEILDGAAMQYTSHLAFEPARRNGRPEPALIAWKVRFEMTDTSRGAMQFVTRVNDLYARARRHPEFVESAAQEILSTSETFARSSTDAISINDYLRLIVLPETLDDYAPVWDDCPLRFVLFDDFLRRFPGVDDAAALTLLQRFATEDAIYASELCFSGIDAASSGDFFIRTIRVVLNDRYPRLELP